MPSRTLRTVLPLISALLVSAVMTLTGTGAPAGASGAEPDWADAASATIHPGVQTNSPSGQCTANFVYFSTAIDEDGESYVDRVFIGHSAHCTSTGAATTTDGCVAESLPLGTPVDVDGASVSGTLVYNSWLTMQAVEEEDANTCNYNDFALIELNPSDWAKVNPSMPFWGGPQQINTSGAPLGAEIYSYGNSGLRFEISQLSPKYGVSTGDIGGGWSHRVYTGTTPGIPGDSGSGYLDADGRALGVVSTIGLFPYAASNNVTDLGRALNYMRTHEPSMATVVMAEGTEPFSPLL